MKVLLVNVVYGHGSTGKIILDIENYLNSKGIETVVAYGRGAYVKKKGVFKISPDIIFKIQSLFSKITGYSYLCSPISTWSLFRIIMREKPDLVNLHCVNANLLDLSTTINFLKKNDIKTILSIHAEFPYTGGCGHALNCDQWMNKNGCGELPCPQFHKTETQLPASYFFDRSKEQWKLMKKAYNGFCDLLVTCVSPWLSKRAEMSPFFKDKTVKTIMNGLNTQIFRPREYQYLIELHKIQGKKILLHVTPNFYSSIKGGKYVLEIAKRLHKDEHNCVLIICGYNGDGNDLPSNVIPIRHTNNQEELAQYYSMADVTLLTSQRETFSMVCAESLCCGTPVVGFKAGGPESISLPEYSEFVGWGNIDELYNAVVKWLIVPKDDNIANKAQEIFSFRTMAEAYIETYKQIITR